VISSRNQRGFSRGAGFMKTPACTRLRAGRGRFYVRRSRARSVLGLALLVMLSALFAPAPAWAATETFNHTGAAQTWIVPAGVTSATFEVQGAQGGGSGGLGGRTTATITVTPGESIQINIGGQGSGGTGGFNGGAVGSTGGHGGGGASDVRRGGTAPGDRVVIAGGGGGIAGIIASAGGGAGGAGGGVNGSNGSNGNGTTPGSGGGGAIGATGGVGGSPEGAAGTTGSGGSGGIGAIGGVGGGGGGGGGLAGGGGGGAGASGSGGGGGGGGSGFAVAGATSVSTASGVRSGNGVVTVTYEVGSVGNTPNLSVTKTDSPDPVQAGENITYTIDVKNSGSADAQSVELNDSLPTNTTFVSLSEPSAWTCTEPSVGSTGNIRCTKSSLAPGDGRTFTLVVKVNAGTASGTIISNTATVTSNPADTDSANNSATATTTVGGQVLNPFGSLNPLSQSGSGSGSPAIIINNNNTSSSSSSAAAAAGEGAAPAPPPPTPSKPELARTGIDILPIAALAMALIAFGYLLTRAAPDPAHGR